MTTQNKWWDEMGKRIRNDEYNFYSKSMIFDECRQQHEKEMQELTLMLYNGTRCNCGDNLHWCHCWRKAKEGMVKLDDVLKVFNGLIGHRQYRKLFERELKALSKNQSRNAGTSRDISEGGFDSHNDVKNENPVLCKCGHEDLLHERIYDKEIVRIIGYSFCEEWKCKCDKFEPKEVKDE